MKKLFSITFFLLMSLSLANAKDLALSRAIDDFVKNKDVTVVRSMQKDADPASATTPRLEWQITEYAFTIKAGKSNKLIDRFIKDYDQDINLPVVYAAYQLSGDNVLYSIEYSNIQSPLIIGAPGVSVGSLFVSANENDSYNKVIVIIWNNPEQSADIDAIKGYIYIVTRDQSFVKITNNNAQAPTNENVRRLEFYYDKYIQQLSRGETGTNIIKAAIFVVDDIIRNGSATDKAQAQDILDQMLSVTPDSTDYLQSSKRDEVKDNARTLLNLIQRMSTNYNPAKFESTPSTFTIEGHIDDELWDIGYYIYTSDDDLMINTNETELIKADGQNFFYQAELDDVRLGRVRALFKDGTVCSAWIDMLFVPGETAELSVHNGYYSLTGSGFYRQWSDALSCMYGDADDRLAYALANIDKPGALCIIFKEGKLAPEQLQTIYDAVPDSIKESAYGLYLRKHLK